MEGAWIRPVGARPTAEVWPSESKYQDWTDPKVLDIIDVPLLKPAPLHHQTENHVIDTTHRWKKVGDLPWTSLAQLCEKPATLWINSDHTKSGVFDCISQVEAATESHSLMLVKPDDFAVEVGRREWDGNTKRTYRGVFIYNATSYSLSITDPVARRAFERKTEGAYPLKEAYICVSLTEPAPQDGRCHKLVAAIISKPPL